MGSMKIPKAFFFSLKIPLRLDKAIKVHPVSTPTERFSWCQSELRNRSITNVIYLSTCLLPIGGHIKFLLRNGYDNSFIVFGKHHNLTININNMDFLKHKYYLPQV